MPLQVQSLSEWVKAGEPDLLSVVIPAHDEEGAIEGTIRSLVDTLRARRIRYEILIVNDNSQDGTRDVCRRLERALEGVRVIDNDPPSGFGNAIRRGLASFRGSIVAIFMADGSDDPSDLVAFHDKLEEGYDCVFGTRFSGGGSTTDYPLPKLFLNRLANKLIQLLFWMPYDDTTNAFKLYRREVIAGVQPIFARHFNLTVELPLKAIIRGYRYGVVPNRWINRKQGISKFQIKELGSRYLFIVLYCLLEKQLSRGDCVVADNQRELHLQVWPR